MLSCILTQPESAHSSTPRLGPLDSPAYTCAATCSRKVVEPFRPYGTGNKAGSARKPVGFPPIAAPLDIRGVSVAPQTLTQFRLH